MKTDAADRILRDKLTGAPFDDWVRNDGPGYTLRFWTQICNDCAEQYNLIGVEALAVDEGSGICGVVGCSKESDHYYDFDAATRKETRTKRKTTGSKTRKSNPTMVRRPR